MLPPNGDDVQNRQDATRGRLVTAAAYFLRERKLADSLTYALRAKDVDVTHPDPTRVLSIASVLSAPKISSTLSDYYAILNVPRFEANVARIWSNFQTLDTNLNPQVNPYSFCSEARSLVLEAWDVLSQPSKKAEYDAELRRALGGCTFWTMCPYCYYVYEYDRAFEDCSLRCTNERCRRVLHAVEIASSTPPPEVVERGYYWCPGFVQLAASGNCDGENLWVPFDCAGGFGGSKRSVGTMETRDWNGSEFETKKRRKTYVHWDSKKKTERVVKLGHSVQGVCGDGNSSTIGNEGGGSGRGFGGKMKDGYAGGVEFFEGDDDVLVGLGGEYNINLVDDEV